MALDFHYYGDPAEVLDRIRAEKRRDAEFAEKKEAVRRKQKGRRIRGYMKKMGLTK